MSDPRCYICNLSEKDDPENVEIRPYGPGGNPVCFDCMIADPEREREAQRQFSQRLDAAGPIAVADGTSSGVRPANYAEAVMVTDIVEGLTRQQRRRQARKGKRHD